MERPKLSKRDQLGAEASSHIWMGGAKLPEKLEVIVGDCLAHARRRFVEVTPNCPEGCRHVLEELGEVTAAIHGRGKKA